ncbi:MAG TPA: polyprenyl synthetase family protein [Egibacteraceae bacterium]|nr:polyprenyl synthetase family protein [Egibacteraceae bacterium]
MALSQQEVDDLARKGAERGIDLRPGLALVEERLRTTVLSDLPFAETASRYLIDAGGKRFRPMLVLLTGMLAGADVTDSRLVDAGVVVELVHLSTLYHDDVIDAADVRRGAPAAHVKWSNTVAILTGDFLLARASELSAALGVEVTRVMARTIADLCAGQIREVLGSLVARDHGAPAIEPTREHYLTVIGEKTASLIAASCRLGAILSGQSAEAIEIVTDYGWRLGMSFQLADDVLDVTGQPDESGKLPGTDLREGVRTLPVLLALEADGSSGLLELLGHPSEANVAAALDMLRRHPAIELARDAARLEAANARSALDALTDAAPAALDGLAYLTDYAVERVG